MLGKRLVFLTIPLVMTPWVETAALSHSIHHNQTNTDQQAVDNNSYGSREHCVSNYYNWGSRKYCNSYDYSCGSRKYYASESTWVESVPLQDSIYRVIINRTLNYKAVDNCNRVFESAWFEIATFPGSTQLIAQLSSWCWATKVWITKTTNQECIPHL